MRHTLKSELIAFLSRLETASLPVHKRREVDGILNHLGAEKIHLPDTKETVLQISELIELFFCAYPALMTSSNKIKLEQYLNNSRQNAHLNRNSLKK